MNKKSALATVMILITIGIVFYQYKKYRIAPQAKFETLTYRDTLGNEVSLSSFRGKKIMVTYFATWCGDCLQEMKALNEVKEVSLNDVEVIAISDEPLEKIISFARRKKYNYTYWKLKQALNEIDIYAIPVTYLINAEGKVTYSKVGAINWTDPKVITTAKKALE